MLYRLGADRANPRFHWVSWGAAAAVVLWVVVSAGFSFYVSNFGSYGQNYGSLGAVRHTTVPGGPTGERDATFLDRHGS